MVVSTDVTRAWRQRLYRRPTAKHYAIPAPQLKSVLWVMHCQKESYCALIQINIISDSSTRGLFLDLWSIHLRCSRSDKFGNDSTHVFYVTGQKSVYYYDKGCKFLLFFFVHILFNKIVSLDHQRWGGK